jgi:hypothetical protein
MPNPSAIFSESVGCGTVSRPGASTGSVPRNARGFLGHAIRVPVGFSLGRAKRNRYCTAELTRIH